MQALRNLLILLLAVIAASCAAVAVADGIEPEEGPWAGKTNQGFQVYFRVESHDTVTNIRFSYREPICSKQRIHVRDANLSVDEAGRFGGVIIPERVEFSGGFVAANRVKGKLVALETSGLPGCLRKAVGFTAHPR